MKTLFLILTMILAGCGSFEVANKTIFVTKSIAVFDMKIDKSGKMQKTQAIPAFVVVPNNVKFNVDSSNFSSGFIIPPDTDTDNMDFGTLEITALRDNKLRVCGPSGDQKCTKAAIRVYTVGVGGYGLYNALEDYSLPMYVTVSAGNSKFIGFNQEKAAIMTVIDIPSNKNVIRLSDFGDELTYGIWADSFNAGAGDYATTLIVEYSLGM